MNPVILFRNIDEDLQEIEVCKKYFKTYSVRNEIPKNSLVIGRYSCLPFYDELEKDLLIKGSRLINSYEDFKYIAGMEWTEYYDKINTPKTWFVNQFFSVNQLPKDKSFIVKGRTNSRKFQWNKRMFAKTRNDVMNVVCSLYDDELIKEQGIVVREYVPLRKLEEGINGMPITNEWRLFFVHGNLVEKSYYWSIAEKAEEYNTKEYEPPEDVINFYSSVAQGTAPFCVLDLAQTENGDWILIEENDGQQSGLSMIDHDTFYHNLFILVNRIYK